ncbi:hypothetical protein JTE90_007657 [Oedothorax gibbosus]|uniref:Uncharacterized protein n=1 Tax=Oedothorax gibbosus TaxID=931172 RepID=A0AAV6TRJ8_9ARAC|nr:hypothetical protein JTE90_007657 [Oedothorax gibbosus]
MENIHRTSSKKLCENCPTSPLSASKRLNGGFATRWVTCHKQESQPNYSLLPPNLKQHTATLINTKSECNSNHNFHPISNNTQQLLTTLSQRAINSPQLFTTQSQSANLHAATLHNTKSECAISCSTARSETA